MITRDTARLAAASGVESRDVRHAYAGRPTAHRTHGRIAKAARRLGMTPPPARVPSHAELSADIAAVRRDLAETRAIMIARDAPPLGYVTISTSPAVTAENAAALATMTEQEIQIIGRMPITPAAYVRTRDALKKGNR